MLDIIDDEMSGSNRRVCRYRCYNAKKRYSSYFKNTLRQSRLVSILCTLACHTEEPLSHRCDIMKTHIRPLLIQIWIQERITNSIALHPHPWVMMPQIYMELLPPLYPPVLYYSTIYHIMTMNDGVTYKIPAYFWCDGVYFSTKCPKHPDRYATKKKFLKFI